MKKLLITSLVFITFGSQSFALSSSDQDYMLKNAITGCDQAGSLNKVKELLDSGVNPDGDNSSFWYTPLNLALGYGRIDIAEELIKHGANIDLVKESRVTPLHFAAGFLRDDGIDGWSDQEYHIGTCAGVATIFDFANDNNLEKTLKYFLSKKPTLYQGDLSPMVGAVGSAICTDAVKILLDSGVSAKGTAVSARFSTTFWENFHMAENIDCRNRKKQADSTILLVRNGLDLFNPSGIIDGVHYQQSFVRIIEMAAVLNDQRLTSELVKTNEAVKTTSFIGTLPKCFSGGCRISDVTEANFLPYDYCVAWVSEINTTSSFGWPNLTPNSDRLRVCDVLKN